MYRDYKDLLSAFHAHGVKYLVVGGFAVICQAQPTNAVESLHMSLRKIIKTRGSFPTEEAAFKLLYLALVRVVAKWETVQHWKQMLNYLDTLCGDRIADSGGLR